MLSDGGPRRCLRVHPLSAYGLARSRGVAVRVEGTAGQLVRDGRASEHPPEIASDLDDRDAFTEILLLFADERVEHGPLSTVGERRRGAPERLRAML